MSFAGIMLIIITIVFCILVFTLIPAILSLKKTAESATALSEMVQQELQPTIRELNSILVELKTVSGGIAEHTGDVKRFMAALGETGSNLHSINRTVGAATGMLTTSSAWLTGAKVAGKYLIERYLKKRGGI